jgi:predicted nucleotidyltransferase
VGLLDHAQMQRELAAILQHPVDLITRHAIERNENAIRREAILSTAKVIYCAE